MSGPVRLLENKSSSESQMDCVNKSFKARITVLFRVDGGNLPSMTVLPQWHWDDPEKQQAPHLIPVIDTLVKCDIY